MTEYNALSEANWARFREGILKNSNNFDLGFWLNKLSEEVGELCQAHTKSKDLKNWQEELGDIAVVIDLIAQLKGTNLTNCAISKFNQTSEDKGSNVRIKV